MAKHEKRWQLLLVAEDGRIIPFKRIKGVALTLMILMVLLGLICAGLAWQLTAEKVRHGRSMGQLDDANRQMAYYKSKYELIAAELVLAEVRMEKAGLLVPRRAERIPQQPALKTIDKKKGDVKKEPDFSADDRPPTAVQALDKTDPTPVADAVQVPAPRTTPTEVPPEPVKPMVALGDLEMKHNAEGKILLARFRVKNTGPRSSPVAGRCVVVLKDDRTDSTAWLAMPSVALVDGRPDGKQGQPFKISRFRDMEIKAAGQTDPSSFKNAIVYVFDTAGALISAKDFSINLPAPKAAPESVPAPVPQPAAAPATTDAPPMPVLQPAANVPVNQLAPGEGSGSTPAVSPPDNDAGVSATPIPDNVPVDDPSLTDGGEPLEKEDARSRF